MLTIPAKKTLKAIQKLTGYSSDYFTHYEGTCSFFIYPDEQHCADLTIYEKEMDTILDLLEAEGYIEVGSGEMRLTQKGIHNEYVEWAEFRKWLCESIFTPIAVSAVTTLITIWLKGL